jgi:hypothetical protein
MLNEAQKTSLFLHREIQAYTLSVGHDAARNIHGQVQFYLCHFLSANSIHAAIFHARFQIKKVGGGGLLYGMK